MDTSSFDDVRIIPPTDTRRVISEIISNIGSEMTCLFGPKHLHLLAKVVSLNEHKILELRSRGIKLRCVTEITQANIAQCKELMKNIELFHTPDLAGSFIIVDRREYLGYLSAEDGIERILRIDNISFVNSQVFLLNYMIDKALPAKNRIIEILKGIGNEFIDTIRDPTKTKSLMLELIRSAEYEIAILFSTKNSFIMAEREGILDELGPASRHGVNVKILVMRDEKVKEISDSKLGSPNEDIQINYLQQFLPTKITSMIIDQSRSLTVEVNDDTKETFQDAIGLSTYSNSESTVFSNASIFESLWIQSELDKQNEARQAYFRLFKGFKLRDEIYNRRWSASQSKEDAKE